MLFARISGLAVVVSIALAFSCSDSNTPAASGSGGSSGGGSGGVGGADGGGADAGSDTTAPSDLVATPLSFSSIELDWTDNSTDETGFVLERRAEGASSWVQVQAPAADATQVVDDGLSPYTTYYYRIAAAKGSAQSGYSDEASARTYSKGLPKVRADHPRIWINAETLPALKSRVGSKDWLQIESGYRDGMVNAFAGLVSGQKSYCDAAISDGHSRAQSIRTTSDDTAVRSDILFMSTIYDWCYAELTANDRQTIGNGILYGLKWQVDHAFIGPDNQLVGGLGHQEGHQSYALVAALALAGETFPLDEDYGYSLAEYLDLSFKHVEDDLLPTFRKLGHSGGGYFMSWGYAGVKYNFLIAPIIALSTATDVDFLHQETWLDGIPRYFMYGLRNTTDLNLVNSDDQGWPYFQFYDYETTLAVIHGYDNPFAHWFAHRFEDRYAEIRDETKYSMYRMLWDDGTAADGDPAALPYAWAGHDAGRYVLREGWKDDDLLVYFKNQPFFSDNHNHRDNGSFVLFYKQAPLAIDSGYYDAYGSGHHTGYYTRAIAHNTVLVDGNQIEYDWNTVPFDKTIAKTPVYDTQPDYTCIAADFTDSCAVADGASQSIGQRKADEMVRYLVYLRNVKDWEAPVLVIFDRVRATQPEYEKRWLLHTMDKPELGSYTTVKYGNAKLFIQTLDNTESSFSVSLHGSDDSDPCAAAHFPNWSYTGVAPICNSEYLKQTYYTPGKWRVEVAPQGKHALDLFVNVLSPASVDVSAPPATELLESADSIGVTVNDWAAVFSKTPGTNGTVEYSVAKPGHRRHLVTGLPASAKVHVTRDGVALLDTTTNASGNAFFEADQTSADAKFVLTAE